MLTTRYVKKLSAVCYASLATHRILIATYELPNIDIMFVDHSRHQPRWVIVKVSRMQYTELNSWVTSLKDAHVCARKIADVLIEKTYIDFRYFLCFEANYCYNFLRGEG
jgi:hypothetical protein